ncbi:MAG: hypothetical protein NTV05_07130 [Acidobacteria bacterium]|nr:hypothetical protein [Acidobacteriota bacterium]
MQQRWHSRRAASRWKAGGIVILTLAAISACGQVNSTGRSASYLIMDSLQGAPGGGTGSGTFSSTLPSDVVAANGGIYSDLGEATLRVELKDASSPSGPSNSVTVTRYHVSFRRSDGRNTQGVDVPYAFDGAATATISAGGSTPLDFVLVRAQAKAESPLMGLRGTGGAIFISTLADVTFYGQDQNGRQVSVTGTISVNFADWAG